MIAQLAVLAFSQEEPLIKFDTNFSGINLAGRFSYIYDLPDERSIIVGSDAMPVKDTWLMENVFLPLFRRARIGTLFFGHLQKFMLTPRRRG